MNLIDVIILGVVQGLSEFIPVSSSGHLYLVSDYLNLNPKEYDVLTLVLSMHIGTLIAVIYYYRRLFQAYVYSLINSNKKKKKAVLERRKIFLVMIATLPIILVGLLARDAVESLYEDSSTTGMYLTSLGLILIGAIYLMVESFFYKPTKNFAKIKVVDAIAIGIGQCFAIFFGVSRSGSTIATAMGRGLNRQTATEFSFLMSIPAIGGAIILQSYDVINSSADSMSYQLDLIIVGIIFSFASGLFAINFLIKYLKTHSLYAFGFYCIALGLVNLVFNASNLL